jgi:DNA-binding transcriptional LysR family regulator
MELRQLRYFVTLAEELHFGRAAAREHIVQSALSQQIQRLERELGVRLLDRSTHHVDLTPAGAAFLVEARQILDHVGRAGQAARNAVASAPTLRVGIIDAGYDTMPQILRELQRRHPDITIHQVEAGTPEQYRQLADGRLDIAVGHVSQTPAEVASKLIRLDPLGVLVPDDHRFADLDGVPIAALVRVRACHLRGNRPEHPRRRRPRTPAPLRALHPLLLPHLQPAGHHLAAPDRTCHALSLVTVVARRQPLSPHRHRHQCRPATRRAARLAGTRRPAHRTSPQRRHPDGHQPQR